MSPWFWLWLIMVASYVSLFLAHRKVRRQLEQMQDVNTVLVHELFMVFLHKDREQQ